jgi:hypothetical protein
MMYQSPFMVCPLILSVHLQVCGAGGKLHSFNYLSPPCVFTDPSPNKHVTTI